MGVVHHDNSSELFCYCTQVRQRCDVPVHAEDAICDNELALVR